MAVGYLFITPGFACSRPQESLADAGALSMLIHYCTDLPGYGPGWAAGRREAASAIVASLFIRDPGFRLQFLRHDGQRQMLSLFTTGHGPGLDSVRYSGTERPSVPICKNKYYY